MVSEVIFLENLYFPEYFNIQKCDGTFIDVYKCRNTSCKKNINTIFWTQKQGKTLKIYWEDDNLDDIICLETSVLLKLWNYAWGRREGLLPQNISGLCVVERTGQALLWWVSALLHTSQPPACIPPCSGCQSLAQQRQCSTPAPGDPDKVPSGQMTGKLTWVNGPGRLRSS